MFGEQFYGNWVVGGGAEVMEDLYFSNGSKRALELGMRWKRGRYRGYFCILQTVMPSEITCMDFSSCWFSQMPNLSPTTISLILSFLSRFLFWVQILFLGFNVKLKIGGGWKKLGRDFAM